MKAAKPRYKFVECAKEDHGKPIFSIQFNRHVTYDMFATVGSNRVTVYKIIDDLLEPVLCFADPNTKESFYCCAWAVIEVYMGLSDIRKLIQQKASSHQDIEANKLKDLKELLEFKEPKKLDEIKEQIEKKGLKKKEIVLLAAGAHGIIRIISPSNPSSIKYLSGHGGAINDLKVSPISHDLVLSASKDHSLRLWNIQTDVCIAIFGGVEGHRDEVLSSDFHCSGTRIISCGMDHSLKIWNFDHDVMAAIELSKTYNDAISKKSFPTVKKHFPTFSTRDIHRNYVDCVAWYGNFILSKSCEDKIVCWRPGKLESPTDLSLPTKYTSDTTCSIMENFEVKYCDIWFLRFSIDSRMKYLALGNRLGKTYIFDLDSHDHDSKPTVKHILSHPKCNSTIRQTCFSNNANILICTCEDGTIWRYDMVRQITDCQHEENCAGRRT